MISYEQAVALEEVLDTEELMRASQKERSSVLTVMDFTIVVLATVVSILIISIQG